MSTLQSLAQIITNGVKNIEATSASRGEAYPMLDDAYCRQNDLIQNRYTADSAPIIAAAYQLIATLTHPDPYLFNWGMAVSQSLLASMIKTDIVVHAVVL